MDKIQEPRPAGTGPVISQVKDGRLIVPPVESAVPICAECANHILSGFGVPLCVRTIKVWKDRVTGKLASEGQVACRKERASRLFFRKQCCGPEGKFFKPKDPDGEYFEPKAEA